jgi:acyl transferase domain-containing protein
MILADSQIVVNRNVLNTNLLERKQKPRALVFPGQGSHYGGMGRDLYESFSVVNEGMYRAASAADADLLHLLFHYRGDVHVGNINSPNQVVLSGSTEAVKDLGKRLKEMGYRATLLRVSMAFPRGFPSSLTRPWLRIHQIPVRSDES